MGGQTGFTSGVICRQSNSPAVSRLEGWGLGSLGRQAGSSKRDFADIWSKRRRKCRRTVLFLDEECSEGQERPQPWAKHINIIVGGRVLSNVPFRLADSEL